MTARLDHLLVELGPLPGPLADTGEDRVAAVLVGDVPDQLLDEDGLAHTGPAEEAHLSSPGVGGEQVDDLDAGLQDLVGRL